MSKGKLHCTISMKKFKLTERVFTMKIGFKVVGDTCYFRYGSGNVFCMRLVFILLMSDTPGFGQDVLNGSAVLCLS